MLKRCPSTETERSYLPGLSGLTVIEAFFFASSGLPSKVPPQLYVKGLSSGLALWTSAVIFTVLPTRSFSSFGGDSVTFGRSDPS
ncbi:MAG: hypothetical protein A4E73_00951 [Syntrophaceae bacterium PtaU1.Bin231]|nr:MAG: hypothetical protein A4E73_00951 [Syntrophaceae bacterium PtaU1.Bin231]